MKLPSVPHWRDPRYMQLAVLVGYAIAAREIFHFERSHWATLTCLATAIVLDVAFGALMYRHLVFPLSAAIIPPTTA